MPPDERVIEMLFDELFNDFFDDFNMFSQPTAYSKEEKKCPVCGRTYRNFRESGKLGCSECYNAFRKPIRETLSQIHSNAKHIGKVPAHSGENLKKKRKYEELKKQLSDAVAAEDYEKAAMLHKKIRSMEGEVK